MGYKLTDTLDFVKLGFVCEIGTQLFKVFARLFQKAAQVLGRGAPRRSSQRAELSLHEKGV